MDKPFSHGAEFVELWIEIAKLLEGKPPELQGAVLADLIAMWLAGHHPALRVEIREGFIELVDMLVPFNEKILYQRYGGPPPGWTLN